MPTRGRPRQDVFFTMNNIDRQTVLEKWWGLAFAIAMIGIVVVTVSLADSRELPLTIIGAVLGVAMTVFATFFLFKGQSKQQIALLEVQHRIERNQKNETEIFKQKLNTYQQFLDALCKYVTTKSDEAQSELKFRTAALAMHGDTYQLTALNREISEIIAIYDDEIPDDKKLIRALFSIAELFGAELYPGREIVRNTDYETSIENLARVIDDSASNSELSEIEAEDKDSEISDAHEAENMESWTQMVSDLRTKGWNTAVDPIKDTITISNPTSGQVISFYKKGRFYVVQAQGKDGDTEFSKALKTRYKGSRRSNIWWRELTSLPNYGVSNGLSTAIETNDKARAVVVKWIARLV